MTEIPNSIRSLLGVPLKHTNSKFKAAEGTHKIPDPLALAVEELLLERIQLGEEVGFDFAQDVLLHAVQEWNSQLEALRDDVRTSLGPQLLQVHDQSLPENASEESIQAVQDAVEFGISVDGNSRFTRSGCLITKYFALVGVHIGGGCGFCFLAHCHSNRKRMKMVFVLNTMSHPRLSIEDSLRADAWALKKIQEYQGGKILMWSWLSRGLTTIEQQAEWNFQGNVEHAKSALQATPGALAELCDLEEVPDVDCSEEKSQVIQA